MNRNPAIIIVLLLTNIIVFQLNGAHGSEDEGSEAIILDSAESFFISLKKGDYNTVWDLLSDKSHQIIIKDVYKATKKMNEKIRKEDIIDAFNGKGIIFKNYWNSFAININADMILRKSVWKMGFIEEDKAEIIITYRKSQGPVKLKMFQEKKEWRVGLTETFWARNILNSLPSMLN